MNKRNMHALILAGGEGSRLKKLTENVPKPLVRIGGTCYLIDFVLSNYIYSNSISGGSIIVQYALNQIIDYVIDWIVTNSIYNFHILPPKVTLNEKEMKYVGTAHSVFLNLDVIEKYECSDFLILAADHVYFMDYDEFFDFHLEHDADLTISTIQVPIEDASRFGVFEVDNENNILGFEEKPENPKSNLISMGIYIFKKEVLIKILNQRHKYGDDIDFGHNIIPFMINENYNVKIFKFDGLWKDLGTVEDYYEFNIKLLTDYQISKYFTFKNLGFNKKLPIAVTRVNQDANIKNCLIGSGVDVSGIVNNSIISRNVIIDENSKIINSIILEGVTVKNSILKNVIVTKNMEIIDVKKVSDDIEI